MIGLEIYSKQNEIESREVSISNTKYLTKFFRTAIIVDKFNCMINIAEKFNQGMYIFTKHEKIR
jgi:hypothetical protein